MAERLVEQEELKRLAHGTCRGHTLALAQRQGAYGLAFFLRSQKRVEHVVDFGLALIVRQVVFQPDVFDGGEFVEKAKVLKQVAQLFAPEQKRVVNGFVIVDLSVEVVVDAINEVQQGGLAFP